jgi:DNA modification methylase
MRTFHKIVAGDCIEKLKDVPDNSVDLVFADPPYNMSKKNGLGWAFSKHVTMQEGWDMFTEKEFEEFNKKWISECIRVLKPGGSFFVSGSFHNIYDLGYIIKRLGLRVVNSIVWYKPNAQPNITCRMFTESTEHLIWAVKGKKWKFNYDITKTEISDPLNPKGKQTRNVWSISLTPKTEKWAGSHPTQKPEELLRRIIISCTEKGDMVLDPFTGTGTTNVVALRCGRNSIGIEKEKDYLKIIKRRLEKESKGTLREAEISFS